MKKAGDIAFLVMMGIVIVLIVVLGCKEWTKPCQAGTCPSWSCFSGSECGDECFCLKQKNAWRGTCARMD